MKPWTLFLGLLPLFPMLAFAGGDSSAGGGNADALEFVTVARQAVRQIQQTPTPGISDLDGLIQELTAAINTTTVNAIASDLSLDGTDKDAINYPESKLIVLNSTRWKQLKSPLLRKALTLHEYLGILKKGDQNYQFSSQLLGIDLSKVRAALLDGNQIAICKIHILTSNGDEDIPIDTLEIPLPKPDQYYSTKDGNYYEQNYKNAFKGYLQVSVDFWNRDQGTSVDMWVHIHQMTKSFFGKYEDSCMSTLVMDYGGAQTLHTLDVKMTSSYAGTVNVLCQY